MKRNLKRIISFTVILALMIPVIQYAGDQAITAQATNIDKVKENIDRLENELNQIDQNISNWEEQQEILEEEMEDLNAEIINTMTSIGMKEDEIAEKETQITNKQADIDATADEYENAKAQEEQQYEDMVLRLRRMYEKGDEDSLGLLLAGNDMGDMLNRMDFVESVYEYDRSELNRYEEIRGQVLELWNQLETEKLDLETAKENLEIDRQNLEAQEKELDALLARKRQQSANYDAEIRKATQEANVAKTKLQQERQELQRLQSLNKKPSSNAANGTYTTNYNATIDNASGSDLGKQVAKYACQYIGNPYVAGGTSLTNGADCSGFTFRVYSDFGYSLPRTSTEQRSAGTGVSYSEAQPGDLICYSGHVGLYIGGGLIVHASTQKTGIKVSNAQYREILAVRRII